MAGNWISAKCFLLSAISHKRSATTSDFSVLASARLHYTIIVLLDWREIGDTANL